ncbi:MAG: addiction module protein [bacterium]|nr:addiction module protein [bacterium]
MEATGRKRYELGVKTIMVEKVEVEEDVESAWKEEIEQRLAELDAGHVELVLWEEVKAKLMRSTGAERTD